MVIRYRTGGCILRLFTDTVTIYKKTTTTTNGVTTESWSRIVVNGVQWSDKFERLNNAGKMEIARYAIVTFPEGTYEGLDLAPAEEDAIFYGTVTEEVTSVKGHRLSDLLEAHARSGRIKSVNDNANRTLLKNIKVVIG